MSFIHEQLGAVLLIAYVASVALIDLRTHRIPNVLSAFAAIVGLSLQIWEHGANGALLALGGAAVGLGMFLPFYLVRAFGAGDVKAMAVVGIFLGAKLALLAAGATLLAGAILGAAILCVSAVNPSAALYRLLAVVLAPLATLRQPSDATSRSGQRFPYGIAIAAGTIVALYMAGR